MAQGYIRKRGAGSYEIRIDLPRSTDGKRKQKSFSVKGTKRHAQAKLTELLHTVGTGTYIESPELMSVADYLERWLGEVTVTGAARERYHCVVRTHLTPALGSIPLAKLRPVHIQDWITSCRERLSASTVHVYFSILRKALNDAIRRELIGRNPATSCDVPRVERHTAAVLSAAEIMQLLFVTKGTDSHIPILLGCFTGMRIGEVCALSWSCVDLEAATLSVRRTLERTKAGGLRFKDPKTQRSIRQIALLPLVVEALKREKQDQAAKEVALGTKYLCGDLDLVCRRGDGGIFEPTLLRRRYGAALQKAGLGHRRFHDLRHSHATLLLEQGVHPRVVQERLGHASVVITQDLYSHVMPTMQRDAADRLERLFAEQCAQNVRKTADEQAT